MEKQKELRELARDLIEGQLKSLVRNEIEKIVREEVLRLLKKPHNAMAKDINMVARNAITNAISSEATNYAIKFSLRRKKWWKW